MSSFVDRFEVRRAAVLGAGVMGAQIAAHLANAGVPVLLFDLAAREGPPNAIVLLALDGLKTLEPSPLASAEARDAIEACNYEQHLARLAECDVVIEAIAERLDWKLELYARIAPHLASHAVLATNTSGLPLARLADGLPAALRPRFCGVHFFNPPRYMALVELIPGPTSDAALLNALEAWLTSRLGKSVVRAFDTPNFIANRVGVFSLLATMRHAEAFGLPCDEVDALTGPLIGRPKSATYRTADVVGLDTLAHVVATLRESLPDDPWHACYALPGWIEALMAQGALGQKTRAGIYRKDGRTIRVFDPARGEYREAAGNVAPEVEAICREADPARRFAALRACPHPQAQFLWAVFRDLFHYVAVHLETIAESAREVDQAMRWGFGWAQGPFELWQAAGWSALRTALQADLEAARTLSPAPLPAWVGQREGVHAEGGSFAPRAGGLQPRRALPILARQLFPERLYGELSPERLRQEPSHAAGQTVWACGEPQGGLRLWTHPAASEVAILSVTTKKHTLGREVIVGLPEAVARAEREFAALVVWHPAPFAYGANLKEVSAAIAAGEFAPLAAYVADFQRASQTLKYARIPSVAAVQGMALGGGCEFLMHCARRVVALESYIGLVEAGVGLIPAGGGCKEFVLRAARGAARTASRDPFEFIAPVFNTIAMAVASKSALQARELGFVLDSDTIVMNAQELLYVALSEAYAMAEAGYRPPLPARRIKVAGRAGIANCELLLTNLQEGGRISAHDYRVAKAAATALCGGEVEAGSEVDEDWLLAVERRLFVELLHTEKTQQRIAYTLEHGKPLRN